MKTRTDEERREFYEDRLEILASLTEVEDYNPEEDADGNKKAMMALVETIERAGDIVNICGNLAGLAVRRGEVRLGPSRDSEKREITLRDTRVLGAALRSLLKERGAPVRSRKDTPEAPEIVELRRALSRLNQADLFYRVFWRGPFWYQEKKDGQNGIAVFTKRSRYFLGIPEEKRPLKQIAVRKGDNITQIIDVEDMGIYPENAQRVYEILKILETEQPEVELPDKRTVTRAGEAEFFLAHLPKGLKPWAETETKTE